MNYNDNIIVIVVTIIINLVIPLFLCVSFTVVISDVGFVLFQMTDLLRYY